MPSSLVNAFNELPRSPTIPTGNTPNKWHFDLRFTRRQPSSSLVLIVLQPYSDFIYILSHSDVDKSSDEPAAGVEFFPDTPQEASPKIVKLLLHFYVNVLPSLLGGDYDSAALAPWQLTTTDKAIADATSAELIRQGVLHPRLCNVGVASAKINALADTRLKKLLRDEWERDDVNQTFDDDFMLESVSLLHSAPKSYNPGDYLNLKGPARYACMARHYGAMLARGTPPDGGPYHGPKSLVKEHRYLVDIQQLLMNSPGHIVKSAADLGDANAALDYGIRLSLGLDCETSRRLSRDYLLRAADSGTASDKTRATAHGLLVFWYFDISIRETVPIHFLYAACHHANQAVLFCERASPTNSPSSFSAIWLADSLLDIHADIPADILLMYPNILSADDDREARLRKLDPFALKRRLGQPHKYFCAAIDCDIQVDFASALSECAGRCDTDKKPSYCSWQCQKVDWPVHKPFCRPGAMCSSVEDPSMQLAKYGDRTAPTLGIPIDSLPWDEDVAVLKSSTLTASQLKALKPFAANPAWFRLPMHKYGYHKTSVGDGVPAQMGNATTALSDNELDSADGKFCAFSAWTI